MTPLRIGGLIFPQFELLDIFGPLELFGMLGERATIAMLGEKPGEIASAQGPKGVADRALADSGDLDVLLVPGGVGTRRLAQDEAFLSALRAASERSRYVASICTGAGLLARAGLLDGRKATTNKISFAWPVSQGPKVDWIRKARWVEDGKYFTASGVSAGMDMTLGLILHLFDKPTALECARQAEYTWNEDKTLDPFA